jgi:nucleoside-diphosphate-sugar epimerase
LRIAKNMKVLVTGATGFLGKHLVQKLVARGDEVCALVWPPSTRSTLQNLSVTMLEGDIQNANLVMQAVKGNDVVFHCAGKVDDWGPRNEFYRVNVDGTRNMLEACRVAGVKHFIHISSLAVLGIPETAPVDETMPYTTKPFHPYMETKLLSEKLVLEYHNKHKLPVTIIRPGILWGPGDTSIFPRLERLASKGLMIFKMGTGNNVLCLSYVPNLVDALLLAADVENPDCQIYHIADEERITSGAYFAALTKAISAKQPTIPTPFFVLYIVASLFELGAKLLRLSQSPLLTRYGLYLWSCTFIVNLSKAKKQLGYQQQVFFKEGMKQLTEWYAKTKG